jgi:predicted component of type VI protein secretion system
MKNAIFAVFFAALVLTFAACASTEKAVDEPAAVEDQVELELEIDAEEAAE